MILLSRSETDKTKLFIQTVQWKIIISKIAIKTIVSVSYSIDGYALPNNEEEEQEKIEENTNHYWMCISFLNVSFVVSKTFRCTFKWAMIR